MRDCEWSGAVQRLSSLQVPVYYWSPLWSVSGTGDVARYSLMDVALLKVQGAPDLLNTPIRRFVLIGIGSMSTLRGRAKSVQRSSWKTLPTEVGYDRCCSHKPSAHGAIKEAMHWAWIEHHPARK